MKNLIILAVILFIIGIKSSLAFSGFSDKFSLNPGENFRSFYQEPFYFNNQIVQEEDSFEPDNDLFEKRQQVPLTIKLNVINAVANTVTPPGLNPCVGGFSVDSNGISICNSDTTGKSRNAYEVDCVFPFQYKGVWYDSCINNDISYFWCSLDQVFNNKFALCQQACPILARNMLTRETTVQIHTACLPPSKGVTSFFPTDAQASQIVSLHNRIRSNTVQAADLRTVLWDFPLARMAQRKAETCIFTHDCPNCRRLLNNRTLTIGQNAYTLWGLFQAVNQNTIWNDIITLWAAEVKDFRFGGPQNGMVGHYTQMVNNLVSRVGCGAAQCGSQYFAYCNYVGGQINYDTPYKIGTPCTNCRSDLCQNSLCGCTRVCQNGGILDIKTCTCQCPAYLAGDNCEKFVCSKTDAAYGCWAVDKSYCSFSNIPSICPNLCGFCKIT